MKIETQRTIVVVAVVALVLLVGVLWLLLSAQSSNSTSELLSGGYTTTKDAAGANSLDNLAQMDDCIRKSDQACETAMLLDGRAFLVKEGTSIDGQEIGYGVFEGHARSGALVGKEIYLPVGAFK